jgi:aldehyde dehydrogenase (NAD+)
LKSKSAFTEQEKTLDLEFRLTRLRQLYRTIDKYEDEIYAALHADFKKSKFETYATEIALIRDEIKYFLKNLGRLTRPEKVKSSLASLPAKSYIYREPYGRSLIIGPWNYPLQLILLPLTGAIAAGNCVLLKPSELSVHVATVIGKIVAEVFDEAHVALVQGGADVTTELLSRQFDHIFFTGSVKVGKIVYEAAAKNLTPCILELGGKSPCIVDQEANTDLAARRIVWGKFLNAGQTCVAPDYLLVHKQIKKQLLDKMIFYLEKHYGENPKQSPDFPRIINKRNFERLRALLNNGSAIAGGISDRKDNYISPTVLDGIDWGDPVMEEEIFGPILPVLEFEDLDAAIEAINKRPKPLALYYFSANKKKQDQILKKIPFGGGCINDTLLQFGSPSIPVGGVGNSGIGAYHGKESFITFSNSKGIVKKKTRIDLPLRYPPYEGKLKWLKMVFKI